MSNRHVCVRAVVLALAMTALSELSLAKVSTSVVLCFAPQDRSISPSVTAEVTRFMDRSKNLGPVVALFVLTVSASQLETEALAKARAESLVSYLSSRDFTSKFADVRHIEAPASDMGCSSIEVAVEIEALFPHDGYR